MQADDAECESARVATMPPLAPVITTTVLAARTYFALARSAVTWQSQ